MSNYKLGIRDALHQHGYSIYNEEDPVDKI